jgi:hypothetical protein
VQPTASGTPQCPDLRFEATAIRWSRHSRSASKAARSHFAHRSLRRITSGRAVGRAVLPTSGSRRPTRLGHHDRMAGQDSQFYMDEPDSLTWLQAWYATQCDGDWEHDYGVSIETLDNPGWFLRLDLQGTAMDGLTFAGQEIHRSKNDWFIARVVDDRFEVACGPLNLGEAIHQFRLWVTSQHRSTA